MTRPPTPATAQAADNARRLAAFLAQEATSYDELRVKKAYFRMTNRDHAAAVALAQIVYWHLPTREGSSRLTIERDGQLWLAKKAQEWDDECCLSSHQVHRVLKKLEDLRLIRTKLWQFYGVPTKHVQLDVKEFTAAWEATIRPMVEGSYQRLSEMAESQANDPEARDQRFSSNEESQHDAGAQPESPATPSDSSDPKNGLSHPEESTFPDGRDIEQRSTNNPVPTSVPHRMESSHAAHATPSSGTTPATSLPRSDRHRAPPDAHPDEAWRLAEQFADLVAEVVPDLGRPEVTVGWAREMGRLLRLGEPNGTQGLRAERIEEVFRWLRGGASRDARFWRSNIRSPRKLRAQIGTILALMDAEGPPQAGAASQAAPAGPTPDSGRAGGAPARRRPRPDSPADRQPAAGRRHDLTTLWQEVAEQGTEVTLEP